MRRVLEEMVPELEDLEKRGYFSKGEIKQIVQKRQDFEYNLRRRAALKADFLRYIEYELSLERLRQLRRKQRSINGPSSLAEHCIIRRTHFIFERSLRRFRGDLSLWSRWLKFCQQSKSTRQMSRVLTRALQLHPTCAALWTYAAAWEFEQNANAVAARALMQRGLRMCKEAPSMWHEYFRMELLYAARLVARRQVLGLTIHDGEGDDANNDDATATAAGDASALAVAAVLQGAVAKVVYTSAVDIISDSIQFRTKFLEVLAAVALPGSSELESYILNDIMTAFKNSPGAVALQARRCLKAVSVEQGDAGIDAALVVFREALAAAPSQQLFDEMIVFIEQLLQSSLQSGDGATSLKLVEACLETIHSAVDIGKASEFLLLTWPRVHLRLGQLREAVEAAQTSNATAAPTAAIVRQCITLQSAADSMVMNEHTESISTAALVAAVRQVDGGRRVEVWYAAIRAAVAAGESFQPLGELLIEQQRGSARGPLSGGMGGPAAALFNALWAIEGPIAARSLYTVLLKLPLPGGEFVHAILDAELSLLGSGGSSALSVSGVREIFEAGVAAFGHEDDVLWMRYMQFEVGGGEGKKKKSSVGAVHWRAVKALEHADAFIAKANLLRTGALAAV